MPFAFISFKLLTLSVVLQWLVTFTLPGAEFDAGHVPGCHPGTRIVILDTLHNWASDNQRTCRLLWLHGPAGVGKSAILQSLAERLASTSSLGATVFFSRPNNRDKATLIIPTIAYQLAVTIPLYREYLKRVMNNDLKLPEKAMEHQFNAMIVKPFTQPNFIGGDNKWVVLLDGLDECNGEEAQKLIIRLISRFTRQHPFAPLVWVIASRPEVHLKLTFKSQDVAGSFEEHDVPANSNDACRDVEKFLRVKFDEMRQNYADLMPRNSPWPTEQNITRISRTSGGLFAFAKTVAMYIEDPHVGNPISQLSTALSVTEGLEPGSLSALYAFYSVILGGVPPAASRVLKLLLSFYTAMSEPEYFSVDNVYPLVVVATMFGLQQDTVYGALRKLHSVIQVPPPDESGRRAMKFYHASFSDYLKTVGGYTIDISVVTRMWSGYFAILHGGDTAGALSYPSPR